MHTTTKRGTRPEARQIRIPLMNRRGTGRGSLQLNLRRVDDGSWHFSVTYLNKKKGNRQLAGDTFQVWAEPKTKKKRAPH